MFAKARRSFGISVGILLLGFMAIAGALVYRVTRDKAPAEVVASVALPAGAEVVSAVVADGAVNVTYRTGGEVHLRLYDQASGEILRELVLRNEP